MSMSADSRQSFDRELDLRAVGAALWRKKLWIIVPALAAALLSFVVVNVVTPRYKSETRVLIEARDNVFLRPEAAKLGDRERSVIDQEAVTSQVQLVLSREVAREVIKQLKLSDKPEFDPVLQGFNPLRHVLILLGISRDPLRMTPEERVFEAYYERISAYQIEKSRVIGIEFNSQDPELAAQAANAISDAYLALQQVVKQDQTKAASEWLSGEIANLRPRVAEAEAKVEEFRSRSNLFMGSNTNSLSNQQLAELTTQLATARSQQAEYEARSQAIRQMLKSGRPIESGDITNSELIRRLNEQLATLRAQLAEQSSTLLDGHPRIKELRAQISDLERRIQTEGERLVRSLENDAKIATARVAQLTSNLDQLKRQASNSNEQDVQLRALEREAKAQRDLLESYLGKYRETTARESLATAPAEARVISRAIVSNTPYFPKKLPIVLIATLGTLFVMAGLVVSGQLLSASARPVMTERDRTDFGARQTPQEVARSRLQTYEPKMIHASAAPLVPEPPPHSVAEVARLLKDSVEPGGRTVLFAVTPDVALPAAAIALGRACATAAQVVLVNLDFDAPAAGSASIKGIRNLLRGEATFGEIIRRDTGSRLHVVAAGARGEGEEASLATGRLPTVLQALSQSYDHVLVAAGALQGGSLAEWSAFGHRAVLVASHIDDSLERRTSELRNAGFSEVLFLLSPTRLELVAGEPAAAA